MNKIFSNKNIILTTLILMDILGGAEIDLFISSFPELEQMFKVSPVLLELLLSLNFVGFCVGLFFVGELADRYGSKFIIAIFLSIFCLSSIICLLTKSYNFLLLGRFLQGLGVSAPVTLCYVIITDLYPVKQQQFLTGILNGITNISIAIAPIIGGYITHYFHWQGNFIALLVLGLITLVMSLLFLPKDIKSKKEIFFNFKDYATIFNNKILMLGITSVVFSYVHWFVFIGSSPLLYIEDFGISLTKFGYYQGSLALAYALGSIAFGFFSTKYNVTKILSYSVSLSALGMLTIFLLAVFNIADPLVITIVLVFFNLALVAPTTVFYLVCLNYFPHLKGKVSALMQALRLITTAISLEIVGYYYDHSFRAIGYVITSINIVAIITMFLVMKDKKFMSFSKGVI